jgi:hypothetical protein
MREVVHGLMNLGTYGNVLCIWGSIYIYRACYFRLRFFSPMLVVHSTLTSEALT